MAKIDALSRPHPPLEDWMPALHNTQLDGTFFWVTNEEGVIVDATPDTAGAAGLSVSQYLGKNQFDTDFASQIVDPPLAVRKARFAGLLKEGGSANQVIHGNFPGHGWTMASITVVRLIHPNGHFYLLHSAHDVTDISAQLDYLRAPAFQGVIMLIVENDGSVLAATDAAAEFCVPGFKKGEQLIGARIEQTQYKSLKQHEQDQLQISREQEKPAQSVEFLWNAEQEYKRYAVARTAFPKGRSMIILLPVPTDKLPFMQLASAELMGTMLSAKNLRQPSGKKLTKREFRTLCDIMQKVSYKDAAARDESKVRTVEKARERLAKKLELNSVTDIYEAVVQTELGIVAQLYSKVVEN